VEVAFAAAVALLACRATPRPPAGTGIAAEFQPAFGALQAAVDEHEDELARRILERIRAREPQGETLQRLRAFRRVLDGRDLARTLSLELVPRELEPGRYRLRLEASYPGLDRLRVTAGPSRLRVLLNGIDPRGFEQRAAVSEAVVTTESFEIRPGEVTRIRIGDFDVPIGTELAVRATWELSLAPGEIVRGSRTAVPINEFPTAPGQVIRRAPFLPTAPVDAAELVRYLRGDTFSTEAMLERAVRIPVEAREEALDALTPVVAEMTLIELERSVPALRWLSGNRELGGDPAQWRSWMAWRGEQRAERVDGDGEKEELLLPSADGS